MKYRKLRVAWTVGWCVVGVMLVVLWVRSYWWLTTLFYHPDAATLQKVTAQCGVVGYLNASEGVRGQDIGLPIGWTLADGYDTRTREKYGASMGNRAPNRSDWDWIFPGFNRSEPGWMWMPMWFFVIVSGGLASAPWVFRRYSLRTLLVMMTL